MLLHSVKVKAEAAWCENHGSRRIGYFQGFKEMWSKLRHKGERWSGRWREKELKTQFGVVNVKPSFE